MGRGFGPALLGLGSFKEQWEETPGPYFKTQRARSSSSSPWPVDQTTGELKAQLIKQLDQCEHPAKLSVGNRENAVVSAGHALQTIGSCVPSSDLFSADIQHKKDRCSRQLYFRFLLEAGVSSACSESGMDRLLETLFSTLALPLAFAFAFGVPAFDDVGLDDRPGCFFSGSGGAWVLI